LRGDGVALVRAARNDARWVALGLTLHGEIRLAWRLFLELDLGGALPFDRARFGFTSGVVAFDTPVLGARASAALALHF
jgi:hypothetical protein